MCYVDGERVKVQADDFYGGRITSGALKAELQGIIHINAIAPSQELMIFYCTFYCLLLFDCFEGSISASRMSCDRQKGRLGRVIHQFVKKSSAITRTFLLRRS
jgi:hypothetical protein